MTEDVHAPLAGAPPPEPPPIAAELEAELGKLAPVAPRRPLRQLAVLAGISLVYGAGLLAMVHVRDDLHELPPAWLAAVAAAWLLGFVAPCYLALVPRAGSMMPRWRWAAASAVITSVAFVVLGLSIQPSGPSSLYYGWQNLARGQGCLWEGLATGLVPVVIGAIFLRGALPVRSRWVAAALGAGGGCLGGLLLHFHCPIADRWHVGLVHGGVVVIAALVTALIVPRATDRRLR